MKTGHALWEMPFKRFSEHQLIAEAEGCVALMGASGTRIHAPRYGVPARAALHLQIRHRRRLHRHGRRDTGRGSLIDYQALREALE